MGLSVKNTLLTIVTPFASLCNRLDGWRRLWAHARLKAALDTPLDPSTVVLGTPEIHGTANIRLGRDLFLYRELYLETRETGHITIGDAVVISRGVHLVAFAGITMESGVMIGEYASIRDANHNRVAGESVRHTGHAARPITIGRNAWIGRGVTVLAGVTIGEGAVVGANAVVTHDVPPGAVVVGIPARPVASKN